MLFLQSEIVKKSDLGDNICFTMADNRSYILSIRNKVVFRFIDSKTSFSMSENWFDGSHTLLDDEFELLYNSLKSFDK